MCVRGDVSNFVLIIQPHAKNIIVRIIVDTKMFYAIFAIAFFIRCLHSKHWFARNVNIVILDYSVHSLQYGPQFSSDCSSDGLVRSFSVRKTQKGPTVITILPTCIAYAEERA